MDIKDSGEVGEASATASPVGAGQPPLARASSTNDKAKRKALERVIARGTEDGMVSHRLEIRIRNTERAGRVVVGGRTKSKDAGGRTCLLLNKLSAEPRQLRVKR